jgi:hypothetical protein
MTRTRKPPKAPRPQRFMLEPGLTRREAFKAAAARALRDFRGFSYNAKTGAVVLL